MHVHVHSFIPLFSRPLLSSLSSYCLSFSLFFSPSLLLSPSPPLSFSLSLLSLSSQDLLVKESVVERLESKNKELSTERDRVESDLLMAQDELEKQKKMTSDLERANADLKSRIERGREGREGGREGERGITMHNNNNNDVHNNILLIF